MTIKSCPTVMEIYDIEGNMLMAVVKNFDETCCEVEIKTVVNDQSWPELSAELLKCLMQMCEVVK